MNKLAVLGKLYDFSLGNSAEVTLVEFQRTLNTYLSDSTTKEFDTMYHLGQVHPFFHEKQERTNLYFQVDCSVFRLDK